MDAFFLVARPGKKLTQGSVELKALGAWGGMPRGEKVAFGSHL